MKVRAEILPGAIFRPESLLTNGFTIGREYEVLGHEGRCCVVRNDRGHERVVMPDGSPSAHIVAREHRVGWPFADQRVVGCFVEVRP